jgi:hypothetical protein
MACRSSTASDPRAGGGGQGVFSRPELTGRKLEDTPWPPPGPARRYPGKWTIGMMSRATMFATLIIGLIAGPAVSL